MQKITPCLWFDNRAEEAVEFYRSNFKNSRVLFVSRYTEVGPGPAGSVLTIDFELEGCRFQALNGGPEFQFTPAISLSVDCDTQEEVDRLWEGLSAGGATSQCGWLTDKFGVSWQIVPSVINEMIADPDPVRVDRVMRAMMPMTKLEIEPLRRAYEGKE